MISRRELIRGTVAGGAMFAPLVNALAAQALAAHEPPAPKRFVFVLFENGMGEYEVQPDKVPLGSEKLRELPLKPLALPTRILDPFTPFKDRMTILQGMNGKHLNPDHGAGYGALSGVPQTSQDKTRARAETIDAALARISPGIFPIVVLGIHGGMSTTATAYGVSAWGRGKPIPIQCRPELAYESLFGSTGTNRNDFRSRKNLLDFVAGDLTSLKSELGASEREQLDYHLEALESLSRRWGQLGALREDGKLAKYAPKLPTKPAQLMPEVITAQFDIATAALTSGLTNSITITSGLGTLGPNYKGFSNLDQHGAGHNEPDRENGVRGWEIVRRAHRFMVERTVDLMKKLQSIPESGKTMLDNTLVVFMSDSANSQHCDGSSWPVVLFGDLGGRLKTGRLLAYPMKASKIKDEYGEYEIGRGFPTNPTLNRLYCTLLHAAGAPRDHFNLTVPGLDQHGPLSELLS